MAIDVNQINQIDNKNQQDQNASVKAEIKKIAELQNLDKTYFEALSRSKAEESRRTENVNKDLLTGRTRTADIGTKILSGLASDLSKIGMNFTKSANGKANVDEELEGLFGKNEAKGDIYTTKNTSLSDSVRNIRKRKEKQDEQNGQNTDRRGDVLDKANVRQLAQDYAQVYAGYVVAASPDSRAKLDEIERKLKDEGLSDGELSTLEKGTRRSLRKDMVSQIQSCFLETILSPKKSFDFVVSAKKYQNTLSYAVRNHEAFGIHDAEGVKDYVNSVIADSHNQLKDFVNDRLEQKFMEKNISKKDVMDDVEKLVNLGLQVGFNPDQFQANWRQKKVDLGIVAPELFPPRNIENKVGIQIGGVSAGGVSDRHGYEMTKEEEKELMINTLRALHMKKALTGRFEALTVTPRIRKTENGLIKLGLTFEDLDKIAKEGVGLARFRSMQQLKESFMERSTFYKLSGGGYDLVRDKIKGIVANLKKLGYEVSKDELDILRDDANRQMFDHTIIELSHAMAVLKAKSDPRLHKKALLMITLLKRIKEESGFNEALGEDIDNMIVRYENQLRNVKESA